MNNQRIFEDSQNYTALVIKLPVKEEIQGLDNLVKVNVFGNECLIGKDSPTDQLYLFFPAGAQLSEAFVRGNNLYRESQANADETKKGFFELNRRVKAIKFRGIISTGFVIPVHSLQNLWTDGIDRDWACGVIAQLKVGDSFNEIDGVEVCRKYFVPVATQSQGKGDKASRINSKVADVLIANQFRFHSETSHLANNLHQLTPSDLILISDKWHGSSCILSKVYVKRKLSLREKILNIFGAGIDNRKLAYIYSSGKPKSHLPKGIEGLWKNDGVDYYNADIWKTAMNDYRNKIEDGISLYGELVGFTAGGSFIQKGYDYGCIPPQRDDWMAAHDMDSEAKPGLNYKFVVYRITYTKPDGNFIEFSWQQIKDYCKKYDIETVKEIYFGKLQDWPVGTQTVESFYNELERSVNTMGSNGKCTWCKNPVPPEGVCVRIDGRSSYSTFKLKSKLFLKKESDDMDKGETNVEDNG